MRALVIITLFTLSTFSGFAQHANFSGQNPETITIGANEEVKNTDGFYAFLDNLNEQNKDLIEMRDNIKELQKQLIADQNWSQDAEKTAQHQENVEILEACEQMLATNKRIMEGKIKVRTVSNEHAKK